MENINFHPTSRRGFGQIVITPIKITPHRRGYDVAYMRPQLTMRAMGSRNSLLVATLDNQPMFLCGFGALG